MCQILADDQGTRAPPRVYVVGMYRVIAVLLVLMTVGCGTSAPSATSATECETTRPNGDTPPGEDPGPTWHGNGRLYTALSENGERLVDSRSVAEDGSLSTKFPWWRAPGVGAAGDLQITGHEVGTGAPIAAHIPDGYGQRFQASGITFPGEGCYEITARSADAELTFIVKVTKVSASSSNTPNV
jgi:hypothetical protein